MTRILCFLLVSNCLLVAQNVSTPVTQLSRNERESMVAAIAGGNSLLEAGKTGDPAMIQPLRTFAMSRRADSFGQHQAVLALAKLGDQKAQQQIVCAFYGDDKIAMQDAAETDLPY